MSLAYSDAEIDLIAGWLKAGLSANVIATLLSEARRATVSRNAIIGIVRRHATLSQIGFARCKPGPKVARTPKLPVARAVAVGADARRFRAGRAGRAARRFCPALRKAEAGRGGRI
jgi:GcrA cell cycle regulator